MDAHKGTFGRVLIVAGSRGMSGAAVLCGSAALRGGAGLVQVAVPESIQAIVATGEPAYLTTAIPENRAGHWHPRAAGFLEAEFPKCDALAIGPGCGRSSYFRMFVEKTYRTLPQPMIVDADALNALASRGTDLSVHAGPRIITPHPGEFSRLTDLTTAQIAENRELHAKEFARRNNIVVLLKGHGTVITDGQRTVINTTGNSGMATGGTGDVLTGLIAALVAQRLSPLDAAICGADLHGLAGDLAAAQFSAPGMTAGDLLEMLTQAWLMRCDAGDVD